jgi:hypothetical protein
MLLLRCNYAQRFFMLNREERSANSNPTFSSDRRPQCIVLVLLSVQLIVQMFIRSNAKEPFILHNTALPRHLHPSSQETQESAYSPSGSRSRTTRYNFAASAVEFVTANYFVLSQITMVAAGLMSTFAPFSSAPKSHDRRHSPVHQRRVAAARRVAFHNICVAHLQS